MCGIGIFQGILQGNLAFFIQLVKVLVEGLHTQGSGFFHHFFDFMDVAVVNQLRNQGRIEQYLDCRHPALAAVSRNEALRNKRLKVERQIRQQLFAPLLGEEVDDAVERLIGAVGVQRRHTQMPVSAKAMA